MHGQILPGWSNCRYRPPREVHRGELWRSKIRPDQLALFHDRAKSVGQPNERIAFGHEFLLKRLWQA